MWKCKSENVKKWCSIGYSVKSESYAIFIIYFGASVIPSPLRFGPGLPLPFVLQRSPKCPSIVFFCAATKNGQNTKPNSWITNSIIFRQIFSAVCTNEENTKKDQKTNLAGEFLEGALQRFHLRVDALKTTSHLLLTILTNIIDIIEKRAREIKAEFL